MMMKKKGKEDGKVIGPLVDLSKEKKDKKEVKPSKESK